MTVQEYLIDIYESMGEDTRLSPYSSGTTFDVSVVGAVRVLGWLNRGYALLCSIKTPEGGAVEFPSMRGEMFFQTQVVEGTASAGTSTTITLAADAEANADQYNGWLVEITDGTGEGQVRLIVSYTSAYVATVHYAWDTTPDATSTFKLYKRFMRFLNTGDVGAGDHITQPTTDEILQPLKITDLYDGADLSYAGRVANYPANIVGGSASPSMWWRYAQGIFFNYAINEERWYRLEYVKEPTLLVTGTDVPRLPRAWQEVLYLWLIWKAKSWGMEGNAAYGAKRDFYDIMKSMRVPTEDILDREDGGFELEV